MNNLSNLTALFAKYANALQYGDRLRPLRDWWLLISVGLVLLIVSAGWSYWLFTLTSNGQVMGGTAAAPQEVKTRSLDAVNDIFSARATEKARYLSEYRFVDPSR